MANFPDYAQISNISLMEELYAVYLADPKKVDPSWRAFFEGIDFAGILQRREEPSSDEACRITDLIQAYRRFGHLKAQFNPLDLKPKEPSELSLEQLGFSEKELGRHFPTQGFCDKKEAPLREIIEALNSIYCSRIGFEICHTDSPEMEKWLQEKIEPKLSIQLPKEEKQLAFEYLNKAEIFETFIHTKYVGQKRFSLEGAETLIPILAEMIDVGAKGGIEEFYLGMVHRGRLNVLTNILNKPYSMVFQEFEDVVLPNLYEGNGDVKYHKGFTSDTKSRSGIDVHLHLAANSSSLESVDGIVLGQTKAKQIKMDSNKKAMAIIIHGDASLTGQGVVYETLQLMRLDGYSTGGSLHIAVNNQIGFTTLPEEGRSTRYCTDIAKTFACPVFHVNAEDPESCLFVTQLAIEFRLRFQIDVFIDLNCYRKYGHNEGDEPSYTQPLQYKLIRSKSSIREIYRQELMHEGAFEQEIAKTGEETFKKALNVAMERGKQEKPHSEEEKYGSYWGKFTQPKPETMLDPFDSSAKKEILLQVNAKTTEIPQGFHLNPKLEKWILERRESLDKIDWSLAENLAFGSLLLQNIPVRLTGQDTMRGTFSQRHAVWVDTETDARYIPLSYLDLNQARFDVYNSPLSEYGCLSFEYGYTWTFPESLVLWEAQFGDFNIGAQTVIDHYITTAEQKWVRYSSLVLLLPHGYEGQGPEHSSGRIERFLQLAVQNNTIIANATTPAQYFHILRRQALWKHKKPLLLFTPKSLLRLPACVSSLDELTSGQFEEVLDDPTDPKEVSRVLFCSGKIYYDLLSEREKRNKKDTAIIRIEQVYPVHQKKLEHMMSKYSKAQCFWVQEEPKNMGAWEFIQQFLPSPKYVGRSANATTATGSFNRHKQEFEQIMNKAFA